MLYGAAVFEHHTPKAADVRHVVLTFRERYHVVDYVFFLRGVGDGDVPVHFIFGDRARYLEPPLYQLQDFFV